MVLILIIHLVKHTIFIYIRLSEFILIILRRYYRFRIQKQFLN